MIYTCIYNCKEGPVHHIEVKKYKSAPHVSTLHSERSWNFFKCESEVYDFMRNIQGWGGRFHFIHIIDVYNTMRGAQNDIHMYFQFQRLINA